MIVAFVVGDIFVIVVHFPGTVVPSASFVDLFDVLRLNFQTEWL